MLISRFDQSPHLRFTLDRQESSGHLIILILYVDQTLEANN